MANLPKIPQDVSDIPGPVAWVPNVGWVPVQGGPVTTDINGNQSTPLLGSSDQNLQLITASAATTSQIGADQTNYNARGVKVFVNMTSAGTGSITVSIQYKDPFGNYVPMLSTAAIIANGTATLTVYPGIATVTNVSLNDVLPETWRVQAIANNANPTTYTVGAMTLV